MAELSPYPFAALVTGMLRELRGQGSVFGLPREKFFLGSRHHDLSVVFHGRRASSAFGPAAGPQSQMAQNLVLSWLGGARIIELKTVQVDDELQIPRPCIDMQTVGYNVEWSQELKICDSLLEYTKGAMLIEILKASGELDLAPGFGETLFDVSVGYDLEGIRSKKVAAFLKGMRHAGPMVEALRQEIPSAFKEFRDLEFPTALASSLTLSTFHGCPPGEIESILEHLLERERWHATVKLNPMLLGPEETRGILNDQLGYRELKIPDRAFSRDTTWNEAVDFVGRLGELARSLELGCGVKFTNTLIVENHRSFFGDHVREMYLSGPPLHLLAMHLVRRFRRLFGDRFPISFSAGIDARNFPDGVALGLVPVTVCTDLLKPGGYGRARGYFRQLLRRMDGVQAADIENFILRGEGEARRALDALGLEQDDPRRRASLKALEQGLDLRAAAGEPLFERWVSMARLKNTESYLERLDQDPRYHQSHHARPPRKIGSQLELFDCITCDKCLPVCPNAANFILPLAPTTLVQRRLVREGEGWRLEEVGVLELAEKHQIANFADWCNDCGNCDVFCPEDGGPFKVKPRFFGSYKSWQRFPALDGFAFEHRGTQATLHARMEGQVFRLVKGTRLRHFEGPDFAVDLSSPAAPKVLSCARDAQTIDLSQEPLLELLWRALLDPERQTAVPGDFRCFSETPC